MCNKNYRICSRCIMDNASDPEIRFDEKGHCNYCTSALKRLETSYFPNQEGKIRLERLLTELKTNGKGKKYDCLMGISGGLDSAYLAYLGARKWGLRICAVHIDDGFDTELATNNIQNLCEACGIELISIRPDTAQYAAVTRAFIRAEVPNIAIPQDNILFAILYKYARDYKINYFLSGANMALESILQKANTYYSAYDLYHLKKIHDKFGEGPLDKLTFISFYRRDFDRLLLGLKTLCPLDLVDYNRDKAIQELDQFCNFRYYEAKHCENILTKVIQLRWFVEKFHVDKRRSHLSSLVVSGQMSREEALKEMEKPLYDVAAMEEDLNLVLTKLKLSREEFETILKQEGKQHTDYPVDRYYIWLSRLFRLKSILKRKLSDK